MIDTLTAVKGCRIEIDAVLRAHPGRLSGGMPGLETINHARRLPRW